MEEDLKLIVMMETIEIEMDATANVKSKNHGHVKKVPVQGLAHVLNLLIRYAQ